MTLQTREYIRGSESVIWGARSAIGMLILCVIVGTCGCEERATKIVSMHYDLLIKRNNFGDTGIRTSLLGYSDANRREQPVVLCEFLHGMVGIFDPYTGRKAIFVERSYEGGQEKSNVFVCLDGRKLADVTAKVVEMAREQGVAGLNAQLGTHFLFGGAERERDEIVVKIEWLRADVGFRGDEVVVHWDELIPGERTNIDAIAD